MPQIKQNNIELNSRMILEPLHSVLSRSADAVTYGLQIAQEGIVTKTLPNEELFITLEFGAKKSLSERNDNFRKWIIKKGFEDLIKALINCLIDAKTLGAIIDNKEKLVTVESYLYLKNEERKKADGMSLPNLITSVDPCNSLQYGDEIRAINKVRNCLVHRNGVVGLKDINVPTSQTLRFYFVRTGIFSDGMEVKSGDKAGQSTVIKTEKTQKDFKLGDIVDISYREFIGASLMCCLFGEDLVKNIKVN